MVKQRKLSAIVLAVSLAVMWGISTGLPYDDMSAFQITLAMCGWILMLVVAVFGLGGVVMSFGVEVKTPGNFDARDNLLGKIMKKVVLEQPGIGSCATAGITGFFALLAGLFVFLVGLFLWVVERDKHFITAKMAEMNADEILSLGTQISGGVLLLIAFVLGGANKGKIATTLAVPGLALFLFGKFIEAGVSPWTAIGIEAVIAAAVLALVSIVYITTYGYEKLATRPWHKDWCPKYDPPKEVAEEKK